MKILIFIEHDAIIRHFIDSNTFRDIVLNHDVKFVFPEVGYKRVKADVKSLDLGAPLRHLKVNQARLHLWKQLFLLSRLKWRTGEHFSALRRMYRFVLGKKGAFKFTILSLPGIYTLARNFYRARITKIPYGDLEKLLSEESPDAIIHPCVLEGVYINDLTLVCNERKIPFIVIMNSWDNPSSKQAMAGNPDRLLVWGEQTRRHAMKFMDLPAHSIEIFGSAQFDVHRDPARINRDEFCRINDIPQESRILLYAGSSKGSDEYSHLKILDDAVENGAFENTTILYRPHPWGNCGYQGERIQREPWKHVRFESAMRSYIQGVGAGTVSSIFPDYRDTRDVLANIDAVISPLSTIIVEAAIHRKPSLCFMPEDETDSALFQVLAPLVHFEDIYTAPEFFVARGNSELVAEAKKLMDLIGDEAFADRLVSAASYFAQPFEEPYSKRLLTYVESIVPQT